MHSFLLFFFASVQSIMVIGAPRLNCSSSFHSLFRAHLPIAPSLFPGHSAFSLPPLQKFPLLPPQAKANRRQTSSARTSRKEIHFCLQRALSPPFSLLCHRHQQQKFPSSSSFLSLFLCTTTHQEGDEGMEKEEEREEAGAPSSAVLPKKGGGRRKERRSWMEG